MPNGASSPTACCTPAVTRGRASWPPRLIAAGSILLLLVACETLPLPGLSDTGEARTSSSSQVKSKKPRAAMSGTSGSAASISASAAKAKPVAVTRPTDTQDPLSTGVTGQQIQLSGLSEQELRNLYGAPSEVEDRAPARIWRYRKDQCALAVSLYPDVQTRVFRILSYEVTGYDGTDQRNHQCWPELRSGAQPR
ncbi:MAG TPA: hypothetical protein VKZ87_16740 [Ferrovibrio sp.]|jgi:hypothetical protein|uniref:hypothetical protein n=1 Tax=Ferrovibrio sp. TaxID=1917215 RepID=UPI002B4ADDB4|nr:hypothetical protein [Ferrovibrio sp.]HLT79033.1 hypothetical protein [Ferrovibrio sp.]